MSHTFEARPHKVRIVTAVVAVLFLAAFTVIAVLLRSGSTGVTFYVSDQIAMAGVGVLLALGSLWFARPRVRAGESGVEVRNMLGSRTFGWDEIHGVSFPETAPWARLELADDEYVPMVAVQAVDGERAVTAMRELRRIRREALEAAETPAEA